jgi:hypothetical protein
MEINLGTLLNMESIWDEVEITLNDEQPFHLHRGMGLYISIYDDIIKEQLHEQE